MCEIQLRPFRGADEPFFQELEFSTTWASLTPSERARLGEERVRAALRQVHEELLDREGTLVLIAERPDGERVGLLWFGVQRSPLTGEEEAWIYNVSVVPEHHGQGLGTMMIRRAESIARQRGFRTLGLMVAEHNHRARSLYERLGFLTRQRVMSKSLTEPA